MTDHDVYPTLDEQRSRSVVLKRRRESVSAREILEWIKARPGVSWEATIRDIEHALDDICK